MREERCELAFGERGYPACVAQLDSPPERLYVRGDPHVLGAPALAIVGSRKATPYGLTVAEMAARVAAESGIAVVSGGALGCDQAAGRAALRSGARHIVVLGTGADVVYPRSARSLIDETLDRGGAVVSLEAWGSPPRRWAFPKRNRVIAALGGAVLIAEAGMPSGTFSTAEAAMELGREVLAVPGSILSEQSRGSNHLVAQGACCIVDEEALEMALSRIFGVLRLRAQEPFIPSGDERASGDIERRLLDALAASPLRVEDIARALALGSTQAMGLLGRMEMAGAVVRLADGRFSPSRAALHARGRLGQNT